jgi:hypothetical protein
VFYPHEAIYPEMEESGFVPSSRKGSPHSRARALAWRTQVFQESVLRALGELREAMQYVHHGVRAEHVQRQRHANFKRGNTRPLPRVPSDVPLQPAAEPHYVPQGPVPEPVPVTEPEFVLLRRPEGAKDRTAEATFEADASEEEPFVRVPLPKHEDGAPASELQLARQIHRAMDEEDDSLLTRRVEQAVAKLDLVEREQALNRRLAAVEAQGVTLAKLADAAGAREVELRAAQAQTAVQAVEIEERTRIVTRRAERVVEVQAKAEQVGLILSNHSDTTALVANFLSVSGLTIERVARLGVDSADIARMLVRPATTSADLALEVVRSCTALPKWAGRVVSAIGAAGLLGVAIPIPPVAAAAGVTAATFLVAGLGLNIACYIVESPFHGLAGTGRLVNAGISLGAAAAGVAHATGQVIALPSHASSRAVRLASGALGMGASLAMRVARSTTITASYVDTLEESVTTRTTRILSAVLAPTIAHAETSLALMRARLAADAAEVERHTLASAELAVDKANAQATRTERAEVALGQATLRSEVGSDPQLGVDIARQQRRSHIVEGMVTGQFDAEVRSIVDVAGIANSLAHDPAMLAEFQQLLQGRTEAL